jgi:hypothetical protein
VSTPSERFSEWFCSEFVSICAEEEARRPRVVPTLKIMFHIANLEAQ